MNQILTMLAGVACAGVLAGLAAPAHAAPEVTLTRFECGTPQPPIAVNQRFSDTYAYGDLKLQFVYSLLSRQAWRRISVMGHRPRHDHA